MSMADRERAQQLLSECNGSGVSSIEWDELHLRLTFENEHSFVTQSAWRLFLRGEMLMGNQDQASEELLSRLKGLKVVSNSIFDDWDTRLVFEKDYVLEVICDSVRYEAWEAHVETGWVIFAPGGTTVFPPAERSRAELFRMPPKSS